MSLHLPAVGIWILRLLASLIMFQTLFFKFTGSEESIFIFTTIGIEPWGRIGTGILELLAVVMIMYNRTIVLGALLGMALMAGAIFFHLTKLGIEVKNDGGQLFLYALLVFLSCLTLVIIYRQSLVELYRNFILRPGKANERQMRKG